MPGDSAREKEQWSSGSAYEAYVGRWSRQVAREFISWLNVPAKARWADVGCGTAALSSTILEQADPGSVVGVDRSTDFVAFTEGGMAGTRASFVVGDAAALPFARDSFDAAVSGLVLNFVPAPERMVAEMARVTRNGGWIAVYVWDYAGEMQMMRHFWDAAAELDPAARELDEGARFPVCARDRLSVLFAEAGLAAVETRAIDVETHFRDFDDFWSPFLGGTGPAPTYLSSLTEDGRVSLQERLRARLPLAPDEGIRLIARANAVRGRRP